MEEIVVSCDGMGGDKGYHVPLQNDSDTTLIKRNPARGKQRRW